MLSACIWKLRSVLRINLYIWKKFRKCCALMLWKKESEHGENRIIMTTTLPLILSAALELSANLYIFRAEVVFVLGTALLYSIERWLAWREAVWGWGNKPASGPWPTLLAPPFSCLADEQQARAQGPEMPRDFHGLVSDLFPPCGHVSSRRSKDRKCRAIFNGLVSVLFPPYKHKPSTCKDWKCRAIFNSLV